MWPVPRKAALRDLPDIPECDPGAPCPMLVAGEGFVSLLYLLPDPDPDWDGTTAQTIGFETPDRPVVAIRFDRPHAHLAGAPNEEALAGHPLASAGLHPCGVFEATGSGWIEHLRRMASVHPRHSDDRFRRLRHLIFTFRDSTVEVAADGYAVVPLGRMSILDAYRAEIGRLSG